MVLADFFKPTFNIHPQERVYEPNLKAFRNTLHEVLMRKRSVIVYVLRHQYQRPLLKFLEECKADVHLVFYFDNVSPTILSRINRIGKQEHDIPIFAVSRSFNKQVFAEQDKTLVIDELISSGQIRMLPLYFSNRRLMETLLQ